MECTLVTQYPVDLEGIRPRGPARYADAPAKTGWVGRYFYFYRQEEYWWSNNRTTECAAGDQAQAYRHAAVKLQGSKITEMGEYVIIT